MEGGPDHGRLYVLPQAPEWIGVLTLDFSDGFHCSYNGRRRKPT